GGPHSGSAMAGRAFFSQFDKQINVVDTIKTPIREIRKSNTPDAHYLKDINSCLRDISEAVVNHYENTPDTRLLVIAGDHSTASGTLAGLQTAYPNKTIGTIWIDAHADIHSPYTSPSGNVHGMPVAAAASDDHIAFMQNNIDDETRALWEETKDICRKTINYDNLVYIGIRDLEKVEWDIIKEHGISYYSVSTVESTDSAKLCDLILR
ncbi:hypothetical protein C1141_20620, partial [Vibrio agarivorans]